MPSPAPIIEFQTQWLPHVTNSGLMRLAELLSKASPLLVHGTFSRALPMGCLASHIAWHHPKTCKLDSEAGVIWLSKVAGLNPATSTLILEWDESGLANYGLRMQLLLACETEIDRRHALVPVDDPVTSS